MIKLIAMYKTPKDQAAFDSHYEHVHTPLVRKIPGLRKLEVARITGAPIGEAQHYLIAEMYFDDQESMQKSLGSPEGKATARDLAGFAGSIVTMFYAEVKEL
ncbi:MAG TPA: EthD family reductase [Bacteroidota bacterium]